MKKHVFVHQEELWNWAEKPPSRSIDHRSATGWKALGRLRGRLRDVLRNRSPRRVRMVLFGTRKGN